MNNNNNIKGLGRLERITADARGPYGPGLVDGILAERRAAGFDFTRQHGPAVRRRYRRYTTHARGLYGLGQLDSILAERRAAGVGFTRQYGPAVGRRYGRCTTHA
jgi:hypothetical protein